MLGVSERTFRRWRDRLRDKGRRAPGSADRRPSSRRASEEEILGACWGSIASTMPISR